MMTNLLWVSCSFWEFFSKGLCAYVVQGVMWLLNAFCIIIGTILDLLNIAFYIFAGVDVKSNSFDIINSTTGEKTDILSYFIFDDTVTNAYLWLVLVGLILIVVFTIYKIIKQDYFDRAGPRSKGPIFRNVAISCIAFVLVVPIFFLIIKISSLLAVEVLSAMGTSVSEFAGMQFFKMCWSDGGELMLDVNAALKAYPSTNKPGSMWFIDKQLLFTLLSDGEYVGMDKGIMANLNQYGFIQEWEGPLAFLKDEKGNYINYVDFYWYIYLLGAIGISGALFTLIKAMIQRIFMLLGLFVVAPAPISQYVLDDGAKFNQWFRKSIEQGLRVVSACMSFSIYLLILSAIGNIDFFTAFETSMSEANPNVQEIVNVGSSVIGYTPEFGTMIADNVGLLSNQTGRGSLTPGGYDDASKNCIMLVGGSGCVKSLFASLINTAIQCILVTSAAGSINDLDGVLTSLISGGDKSLDSVNTGKGFDSGLKTVEKVAAKGVGVAVGAVTGVAGVVGAIGGAIEGAAAGHQDLDRAAKQVGSNKDNESQQVPQVQVPEDKTSSTVSAAATDKTQTVDESAAGEVNKDSSITDQDTEFVASEVPEDSQNTVQSTSTDKDKEAEDAGATNPDVQDQQKEAETDSNKDDSNASSTPRKPSLSEKFLSGKENLSARIRTNPVNKFLAKHSGLSRTTSAIGAGLGVVGKGALSLGKGLAMSGVKLLTQVAGVVPDAIEDFNGARKKIYTKEKGKLIRENAAKSAYNNVVSPELKKQRMVADEKYLEATKKTKEFTRLNNAANDEDIKAKNHMYSIGMCDAQIAESMSDEKSHPTLSNQVLSATKERDDATKAVDNQLAELNKGRKSEEQITRDNYMELLESNSEPAKKLSESISNETDKKQKLEALNTVSGANGKLAKYGIIGPTNLDMANEHLDEALTARNNQLKITSDPQKKQQLQSEIKEINSIKQSLQDDNNKSIFNESSDIREIVGKKNYHVQQRDESMAKRRDYKQRANEANQQATSALNDYLTASENISTLGSSATSTYAGKFSSEFKKTSNNINRRGSGIASTIEAGRTASAREGESFKDTYEFDALGYGIEKLAFQKYLSKQESTVDKLPPELKKALRHSGCYTKGQQIDIEKIKAQMGDKKSYLSNAVAKQNNVSTLNEFVEQIGGEQQVYKDAKQDVKGFTIQYGNLTESAKAAQDQFNTGYRRYVDIGTQLHNIKNSKGKDNKEIVITDEMAALDTTGTLKANGRMKKSQVMEILKENRDSMENSEQYSKMRDIKHLKETITQHRLSEDGSYHFSKQEVESMKKGGIVFDDDSVTPGKHKGGLNVPQKVFDETFEKKENGLKSLGNDQLQASVDAFVSRLTSVINGLDFNNNPATDDVRNAVSRDYNLGSNSEPSQQVQGDAQQKNNKTILDLDLSKLNPKMSGEDYQTRMLEQEALKQEEIYAKLTKLAEEFKNLSSKVNKDN